MGALFNLRRVATATTGTGTITLGSAVTGFKAFSDSPAVADQTYVSYAISDGNNSEVGIGLYTASGTTLTRNVIESTNSNSAINLSGNAQVFITPLAGDFVLPRGYLSGCTLSNDGTTPNTVLDVSAGLVMSDDNLALMSLTALTKSISSTWAVGTGNGGLDTGTVAANTWYHVYIIQRPDTGVVDMLISTSASSPTMPTNYTRKRRVGSIKADGSSHILGFVQLGDEFLWKAPVNDFNSNATSTPTLTTLSVPTGVQVRARTRAVITTTNSNFLMQSPDETSAVSVATTGNLTLANTGASGSSGEFITRTNTSGQVRISSSGTTAAIITTYGWYDERGKAA
jgi:hypothetical protein